MWLVITRAPGFPSVCNVIKHSGTQNTTGLSSPTGQRRTLLSLSLSLIVAWRHTQHLSISYLLVSSSMISMQEVGFFHSMPGRQDQTGCSDVPRSQNTSRLHPSAFTAPADVERAQKVFSTSLLWTSGERERHHAEIGAIHLVLVGLTNISEQANRKMSL